MFRLKLLLTVCLAVAGFEAARAASFSVCIDTASPQAGGDKKLAQALAHVAGAPLRVFNFDGSADGDETVNPKSFAGMLAHQCNLVLGFPVDATGGVVPPGTAATAPYGNTGFIFVTPPKGTAQALADLPNDTDVAVTYGSIPNLYFASHPNTQADIHLSEAETLHTLLDGQVKAAMLWQPTLAAWRAGHPTTQVRDFPIAEPHSRWNIVALYLPNNRAAAGPFEAAAAALRSSGDLARIMAPYGIDPGPWQPVMATLATLTPAGGNAADIVRPALYTAAQADQGAKKFADNCAQCHGEHLEGIAGPALKGENFASTKAGFAVGDVFAIVYQNMPATQPGTLPHDDYVQIMAFLLQQNGYPAGSQALTFDGAKSSKVPLVYKDTKVAGAAD
jgi:mono/diheme cytochrome c family protein